MRVDGVEGNRVDIIEATGWAQAALVVVHGDIDVEDAVEMESFALAVASASDRAGLIIDMSGVDFMGSAGLSALMHVKAGVQLTDRWMRVIEPSPAVQRVLEITGTGDEFLQPAPVALTERDETFDTDDDDASR